MKKNNQQRNNGRKTLSSPKGYTIIETMIAVSIFLVVVMIAMGALLNANLLHQKSRDMRSIIDNLSFIMEDMSRNLRTGSNYYCITAETIPAGIPSPVTRSCGSGGGGISFKSATGPQWIYYIDTSGRLFKSEDGGVSSFQLTPNEVVIDRNVLPFLVFGAEPPSTGDERQPFVTIRLVGQIVYKPNTSNSVVTPFSLQTSTSQRAIDI